MWAQELGSHWVIEQDRQYTNKISYRSIRVKIVAVEKQQLLYILNVSVAFVIQHAKRKRLILISSVGWLALPYFSKLSPKQHDFPENIFDHKMYVFKLSTIFYRNIYHSKRELSEILSNVHRSSCKVAIWDINGTLISSTNFGKILKCQIPWKTVQWEPRCPLLT